MSNDGHCVVCDAVRIIDQQLPGVSQLVPEVVKVAIQAYIEGLEDEGVAQRDRFCLTHRAAFDVQVEDTEHGRFP